MYIEIILLLSDRYILAIQLSHKREKEKSLISLSRYFKQGMKKNIKMD